MLVLHFVCTLCRVSPPQIIGSADKQQDLYERSIHRVPSVSTRRYTELLKNTRLEDNLDPKSANERPKTVSGHPVAAVAYYYHVDRVGIDICGTEFDP